MSVAGRILAATRQKGWRIATAESCTGGLVMATLTSVAGGSDVLEGGVVTYSNRMKLNILNISEETLDVFGAVSEQVALEMAVGVANLTKADLCLSVTGIAGPGGSEQKPEGRVCFSLYVAGKTRVETVEFGALGRENVRQAALNHGLSMLASGII
ncbi:MAG: CinA family protein [Paracoccaceae bacterium]